MTARSPWEHIGGAIVLGGLGITVFADLGLGLLFVAIGALCIARGWRVFKAKHGAEARRLLDEHLDRVVRRGRDALAAGLGDVEAVEVSGPSGIHWQIETEVLWDGEEGGDLRVVASIDDGGLPRSIVPITQDRVVGPGGGEAPPAPPSPPAPPARPSAQ